MPKLIVKANQSDRQAGSVTRERVLATRLHDDHDAARPIERLTWAAVDTARLQSPRNGEQADEHVGLRPVRPPGDTVASRPRTRPSAGERWKST
jgi:hypothetical protein